MQIGTLQRRLARMVKQIGQADQSTLPEFICYWGHEEIPGEGEPGVIVIRTEWDSFRLAGDTDHEQH